MNEPVPVLADPQFDAVRVLRPYADFEDDYQGQNTETRIIMLTEGGIALDHFAQRGESGYDASLVRGIPVPLGSRVVLWLPTLRWESAAPIVRDGYRWNIFWRLRNLYDYNNARMPYHYPKQGTGAPNAGAARVVIPVARETIVYTQTEPAADFTDAIQNAYAESYKLSMSWGTAQNPRPLIPGGGFGEYQQGITDPAVLKSVISYGLHECQALGDELLIGITRDSIAGALSWNFNTSDEELSQYLGNGTGSSYPDIGVYVMCGSAP